MKSVIRALTSVFTTTPQALPIPLSTQSPNNAGGFGWDVDDWTRLDRFLVLGSEAGTYYVGRHQLAIENATAVIRCLAADGPRVVRRVVEISDSGRAPKNDPAIFVLALCMKKGDDATRKSAQEAVPRVCRIGTHIFSLAEAVQTFGGWGRGTKRAFGAWYTGRDAQRVAFDAIKYQSRDGWSHRDVLRLAKPVGFDASSPHGSVFHWITKGWPGVGVLPHPDAHLRQIWAFERAKTADEAETVRLIVDHGLPRECIATHHLNSAAVWDALLTSGKGMPLTAMTRNLAKMTAVGLLSPLSDAARFITARLGDIDALKAARVHPLAVLSAQLVYAQGHGEKGSLTWTPVATVVDALDRAFYATFQNVPATGKRLVLAVDVSGSMSGTQVNGLPNLPAATAAAALALVTAATEPNHHLVAFDTVLKDLPITPRMRLAEAAAIVKSLIHGGTDCSLPMVHATQHKTPADAFVILTDSETWQGQVHPAQAIQAHRKATGIRSKLAVVAMCSNHTSIADPGDAGMLNVVGFDTAVPEILREFVAG